MNSKSLNTFLIAAVVLSSAACKKNIGMESYQDRSLSFDLAMADTGRDLTDPDAGTKAFELKSADGSICLPLEYSVTDGIGEAPQAGEAQTKGTQYNYLQDLKNLGTFNVTAWSSNGDRFIPEAEVEAAYSTVNYNSTSSRWTIDGGTAPMWKNADEKTFFAYANLPDGASVTCGSNASHTFTYTILKTDAADQNDALLGYYKGIGDRDGDGTADGVASIKFIHPLTAVVFKRGEFVSVDYIRSLSIEGVYDGGTAEVSYEYSGSNLVPTVDWGTSRNETTTVSQTVSGALPALGGQIGESFILIPQNLSEKKVTIKAVVALAAGGEQTVQAELNTGNWEAGKTNTYTLGYDARTYTYTFELSDGSTSASWTFKNDTSPAEINYTITSKRTDEFGHTSDADWLIKSVKIGSGEPEMLGATSFTNIGGLNATQRTPEINFDFHIVATARNATSYGTHDYWTNEGGISGDTEGTGWSPKDWSGTYAKSSSPLDLSKFNFQDESMDNPMTTANCYIIRHAGTYKLPLVYGNAVVNGLDNVQSYYPNGTGGSNRLERFVNSTGVGIESPFIENAADCGGEDLKCAVVWQDKAEVVKSLQIVGNIADSYTVSNVRYLQFSISQEDICQNNALICVYKDANSNGSYDSGEAIWSWHIWITNDPALLSGPIPVSNFSDNTYNFFPLYNLGWIEALNYYGRDDVEIVLQQKKSYNEITITIKQVTVNGNSSGCFYQFGRKDPMPTADVSGYVKSQGIQSSLSNAICNPGVFYCYNSNSWCSELKYNLWTGKKSELGVMEQDVNMIKTIYDPSPVGYKMPASAAFTGFTKNGNNGNVSNGNVSGSFNKGWYFYTLKSGSVTPGTTPTIFFSASGSRPNNNGDLTNPGGGGNYWSAVVNNDHADIIYQGCFFDFNETTVINPKDAINSSYGVSVRPVRE